MNRFQYRIFFIKMLNYFNMFSNIGIIIFSQNTFAMVLNLKREIIRNVLLTFLRIVENKHLYETEYLDNMLECITQNLRDFKMDLPFFGMTILIEIIYPKTCIPNLKNVSQIT